MLICCYRGIIPLLLLELLPYTPIPHALELSTIYFNPYQTQVPLLSKTNVLSVVERGLALLFMPREGFWGLCAVWIFTGGGDGVSTQEARSVAGWVFASSWRSSRGKGSDDLGFETAGGMKKNIPTGREERQGQGPQAWMGPPRTHFGSLTHHVRGAPVDLLFILPRLKFQRAKGMKGRLQTVVSPSHQRVLWPPPPFKKMPQKRHFCALIRPCHPQRRQSPTSSSILPPSPLTLHSCRVRLLQLQPAL